MNPRASASGRPAPWRQRSRSTSIVFASSKADEVPVTDWLDIKYLRSKFSMIRLSSFVLGIFATVAIAYTRDCWEQEIRVYYGLYEFTAFLTFSFSFLMFMIFTFRGNVHFANHTAVYLTVGIVDMSLAFMNLASAVLAFVAYCENTGQKIAENFAGFLAMCETFLSTVSAYESCKKYAS